MKRANKDSSYPAAMPKRYNTGMRLTRDEHYETAVSMTMVDNQNDVNEVVDRCSPDSPEGMMGSHKNGLENQHKTANSYNKEADSPFSITNYHQDIEILANEDEGKNEEAIYQQLDTSNFDVNTTHIQALIEEINYDPGETTCNAENLEENLFPVDDEELFDEIENDSDLEEPETDKEENCTDAAIYHGHDMPVWVSMVMILLQMITNFVSKHEIEQILILISAHCLEAHPGLKSLYHFKKHFASFSSPLKKHFYCINCLACVNENANKCVNQYCLKSLTNMKSKSYFIELPIKDQLSVLFNRENFTVLLQDLKGKLKLTLSRMCMKVKFIRRILPMVDHYQRNFQTTSLLF